MHAARAARRQFVAGILDRHTTMATYLFAWNPALWSWPELPGDIRKLKRRGHVDIEWSGGRTRTIEVGSRAFLVRVGVEPRGIFGAGYTLTAPEPREHWRPEKAAQGAMTQYLHLRLETLLELPSVTYADLAVPPFSRFRWGVRQSGTSVPTALADALENLWEARLTSASSKPSRAARSRA
jgi:5-methylcytosine-specific restriction enzyme A